jgi:predicted permease
MLDDVRSAVRSLRSTPGFTAVALVVLALGIGSATAIFSVVDAVVLRGLPFDEHDRLVSVFEKDTKHATTFGEGYVTPQTYLDWRGLQRPFEGIAAVGGTSFRLKTEGGEPADARAQKVTWEFFPVLHVSPLIGRALSAKDESDGAPRVVMLSYGFWQRRYGGAADVVGKLITLNDLSYEIVGVMPRSFSYPVGSDKPTEVLVPRAFSKDERLKGGGHGYNDSLIARLRKGVTLRQAADEMSRLSEQLDSQYPTWNPGRRAVVESLHDHLVGKARGWMLMLLGAVVLVMLIACANVANLLLVRATARAREMGIRAALGATAWRLIRVLLLEGLVLSLAGAAIGVGLAYGGVQILRAWLPAGLPRVAAIAIDVRVLVAAVAAALATGGFFGIAPALQFARPDMAGALKEGGRSSTSGKGAQRLRNALVVVEVAIAVVLLVGAGLFTGSFVQLMRVDPGFDYHDVLTLDLYLTVRPGEKYDEAFAARGRAYVEQVVTRVKQLPGVVDVATLDGGVPLSGSWSRTRVTLPGRGEVKEDEGSIDIRTVSDNYLQLLRVPLLRGRYFSSDDRENSTPVVMVNQAAAQMYWPGQDAVGRHITLSKKDRMVVGVVGNIHHLGPEIPPRQECYVPVAQNPQSGDTLVVRTQSDPMRVLPAIKSVVWSLNPEQRFSGDSFTLEQYLDRLIAQRRFNMALLALFGALGLVIAAVGIYGVMAYVVAQRTTEIGVRMALGATRGSIIAMVLRRATALVAVGLVIGGVTSWYLSAGVKTLLFEIRPNDARILAAALVTLAATALLASALPARRAASVDPLEALRVE